MRTSLRKLVRHRAGTRCEYCRQPELVPQLQPFHLEHIRPRCHGGMTSLENLAWACSRCNLLKGANLTGVDPTPTGCCDSSTLGAITGRLTLSWTARASNR